MIDPFNITDYFRNNYELEEFWLFCLAVAGKSATQMAKKVDDFLEPVRSPKQVFPSPFTWICYMYSQFGGRIHVDNHLRAVKMGKYNLLTAGYVESAMKGVDWFRTASADDIAREIPGAGFKTSRFFVLHSRVNANVAVIDTHMLKYLTHIGVQNVPKSIPTGAKYLALEKILLAEAAKKQMAMADFDLAIWSHYANKGTSPLP